MDHGNGTKTYIADAAGQPVTQNEGPVGSPGELLVPDRYEFYTFDESGDLVKRLMTLDQIQGLIAGGDSDAMDSDASAPIYYHENLPTDSNGHMDVTDMETSDIQGVHSVVASVQNVLKSELEATKKKPVSNKPLAVLNMPDAASSWSILLPGVLGGGSDPMIDEDDSSDFERITLTIPSADESTTAATTTKATTTTTIGTTITTTEEPSTTVKYVTKRPTDSPTVVHYLPIQNIPTKKPNQPVKVSTTSTTETAPSATPTIPGHNSIPVTDEMSASLSSVLAQVTDDRNRTADVSFVPIVTTSSSPTKLPSIKIPNQNCTTVENVGEKSNTSTPMPDGSLLVRNATTVDNNVSITILKETDINNNSTSASNNVSLMKDESLEPQSSNDNTPTYDKTPIEISTVPSKSTSEEFLIERNKPSTHIDESLKEFIATTISGSDISLNPVHINTTTAKPIEIKSTTVQQEAISTTKLAVKTPIKPISTPPVQSYSTSEPTISNFPISDPVSSKPPTSTSTDNNSSTKTKTDYEKETIVNAVDANKTNINIPTISYLVNNTISTLETTSVNTQLRNSPTTINPIKLESSSSDDGLLSKTSLNKTTTTISDKVASSDELVTSSSNSPSQNSSVLPIPIKYNTTVLNLESSEAPPKSSDVLSTSMENPMKSEPIIVDTINSSAPELLTTSEKYDDNPVELSTLPTSTEYILSAIIIGNVTNLTKAATTTMPSSVTEPTNTTSSETDIASTTFTPDKIKNKNTDKYDTSESKFVTTQTNKTMVIANNDKLTSKPISSDKIQNLTTTKSQNTTNYTKPIKPITTDEYFTITTYKPSTNQPIKISTKINNDIEYSIKIPSLKPHDEIQVQNMTENNQSSYLTSESDIKTETSTIEVKLNATESQVTPELLSTLEGSNPTPHVSTTDSMNLNSSSQNTKTPPLSSTIKSNNDHSIRISTSLPNPDITSTESTTFTTTLESEPESTDNTLTMENDPSVHASISAVTNILLEDKPSPPNEPQIPLPTSSNSSSSTLNVPKPANGELKYASIKDEDYTSTTEINDSSTIFITDEPDSTTIAGMYTVTGSINKESNYNTSMTGSNQSLSDENLEALSSSLVTTNENKTDEFNSTENNYEIITVGLTTVEEDNPTTTDAGYETTTSLRTTTNETEQNIRNESLIERPVMQAIPTKESKLNPDHINTGEPTNLDLNIEDAVIDENNNITEDNANTEISNEYTTPEQVLISSSNDKKETTPTTSTTENISTVSRLDTTTTGKIDKETVTEKIALKTAVKPDDTKSQVLKKPATQNVYRPLPDPPLTPPTAVELHPAPHESMGLEASTAFLGDDVRRFSDLCNELAFRMWTSITGKGSITSRSLVFSPFSATSLLAMVFLGARGPTSGQMNDILRLDDMVTFNPHQVLQNITESVLNSRNYGVATAAFIRELYSDKVISNFCKDQFN